ncbi:RyR domain-containing protein [Fundidesulfovibrio agrisoli]|uniref:RyR domain-containing protein n=1 Tax=Fundidesulfovibrio agrisoli TaxID=2922717 RepID=UPI001FAB8AAA|nr:RyR domain-containing protein [Fundidesulfovibrio agrisoli]
MTDKHSPTVKDHMEQFSEQRSRYGLLARIVRSILEKACSGMSLAPIFQDRVKSPSSFADKIICKGYSAPFTQTTDFCGVRVITITSDQVKQVCGFIRDRFEIDENNSADQAKRLNDAEFGYRSVHFIVSLRKNKDGAPDIPQQCLDDLGQSEKDALQGIMGLKAEIQVRTLMQHAWASVVHDTLYKSAFKVLKKKWSRDAARIAALIEDADKCFVRLLEDIEDHKSSEDSLRGVEDVEKEIKRLSEVLPYCDDKGAASCRIARLSMLLDRFDDAESVLTGHYDPLDAEMVRTLAEVRIKSGAPQKRTEGLNELRAYLAREEGKTDTKAMVLLGGALGWADLHESLSWFEKAFGLNPTEPAILRGYLERSMVKEEKPGTLTLLFPVIDKALEIARSRAAMETGLPWTHHDIGMLELMRGRPYASLEAFAQAVTYDVSMRRSDALIDTLGRIGQAVGKELQGVEWARQFLILARANQASQTIEDDKERAAAVRNCLAAYGLTCQAGLEGPVFIVAGGCDPSVEAKIEGYRSVIENAFAGVSGTVICGGTTAGVSGIMGDLLGRAQGVRLVSYLPDPMPQMIEGVRITVHEGYQQGLRFVAGGGFSPLGPIQGWMDILASGLRARDVKVLGVNGGLISAAEYVVAAALGAKVGLIQDSGRQAFRLLDDPFWSKHRCVMPMPNDKETIKLFITPPKPPRDLAPADVDILAIQAHEGYRSRRGRELSPSEPALASWDKLLPHIQESNRQQVGHIEAKLDRAGLKLRKAKESDIVLFDMNKAGVVEDLAEYEHARWNLERLMDGWTRGDRDPVKKTSPYLVPWNELPDDIKKYDREAVEDIPAKLAELGYEVYRP